MKFTFGADPELFLTNGQNIVSAIEKIGGTKAFPLNIGNGCSVQEDNIAAEFNIPPCEDVEQVKRSIDYALSNLKERAAVSNLFLNIRASTIMSPDELKHPLARTFGCDPDFNAWKGGEMNPKPVPPDPRMRSCGGHVHIGYEENIDPIEIVKACELFYVPSIYVDKDDVRRKFYGFAGSFRYKPYGLEWRTPSNWWITTDEYIEWMFNVVKSALTWISNGNRVNPEDGKLIQNAINNSDTAAADWLIKTYELKSVS